MFESFDIIPNAEMRQYTTLRLGGPADWLAFPRSGEEIAMLFAEAGAHGIPVTVIGHGSNLLGFELFHYHGFAFREGRIHSQSAPLYMSM